MSYRVSLKEDDIDPNVKLKEMYNCVPKFYYSGDTFDAGGKHERGS